MGCKLRVRSGVIIPFNKLKSTSNSELSANKDVNDNWIKYNAPYRNIVKELQSKRSKHPKKTFYNYMYKEITNSIYGQIAMGIGGKNTFDVKTGSYIRINGSSLSSPILASYITGFVRALISHV